MMVEQCAEAWGQVRCEAVAGHDSAHSARRDATLLSWVNHGAPNGRKPPTEWVQDGDGDDE